MLVEDVDLVDAQVTEAVVGDRTDVVRAAVEAQALLGLSEAELGGQDHLVAEVAHRLAEQNLVVARTPAVDLGGVEEGDAQLVGAADGGNARLLVTGAVALGQAHRAVADRRDRQALGAEFPVLHANLLMSNQTVLFGANADRFPGANQTVWSGSVEA